MARRGRCRCGAVLSFRRTPQGYKMRCPGCKAVVRLRRAGATPPPPPLPPLPEPLDFSALAVRPSTAPPAAVDLPVFRPPEPRPAEPLRWWLLGGAALAVFAVVGVVTFFLS